MSEIQQTIEIAGVRCSLSFEDGSFRNEFEAVLANYRRWGFCADGRPNITITVKNSLVPRPDHLPGTTFYNFSEYDSVSATALFDAETLKGTIGIIVRQADIFTPARIVEMIETYIATVYLLYLFLHGRGTLIHSSGICDDGSGYIFAGPSGNGKSTIARLSHPRTVLCDDLVVLRKNGNGSGSVYGTPFSGDHDSVNKGAECKALFFIEQSTSNELVPMSRMSAVIELMKEGVIGNLLSQPDIARVYPCSKMLTHLIDLLEGIPCYRLRFRKDESFWEIIHGQHQQTAEKA